MNVVEGGTIKDECATLQILGHNLTEYATAVVLEIANQ